VLGYNRAIRADDNKHNRIRKTINRQYDKAKESIMLHKNDFALEQLETRLETLCIYVPYIATCYKTVWFVRIPYPCVEYYRFCF